MVNRLIGFGARRAVEASGTATVSFGAGYYNSSQTSTYTESGASFPDPEAGRVCVVFVSLNVTNSDANITGVTIGGNTMSELYQGYSGDDVTIGAYAYVLGSGATADVAVSWSGGTAGHISLATYSVLGADGATPYDTDGSVADPYGATGDITVDIPAGGVLLSMSAGRTAASVNCSWEAGTEDYESTALNPNQLAMCTATVTATGSLRSAFSQDPTWTNSFAGGGGDIGVSFSPA